MKLVKKIAQHSASLYAVCYSPELDLIFTGGADKIVASWNPTTFENTSFSIKTKSAVLNLTCLPNNRLFIGLFNGDFHIIDLSTKEEVKYFTKHKKGVYCCSVTDNGLLVIGSGDGLVSIWNSEDYSLLFEKQICNGKIRAIESVGGNCFIGDSEGFLLNIDLETLALVNRKQIIECGISSLCYLPHKESIIIGDKDAGMHVYNVASGEILLSFPAHNWPIYQIIFDKDLGMFSCSRDKTIKEWNANSLDVMDRLAWPAHKGHTHSINNLCFSQHHKALISVSDDKVICIWK